MSLGNWKDKIKEAKDQKLSSVQDSMASAKDKAAAITPSMQDLKEKASAIGPSLDSIKEKLGGTLGEINALKPVLKEHGFNIADIEVEISIPPSITAIIQTNSNDVVGLEKSLEAFGEMTKIQKAIVGTIKKISGFQETVSKSGHRIGEIEIGMGIPPSVVVHLPPID
tara:strand:+ start:590 stop:1093 length:504 start_codon:yes stop_codon:yes gene_type:complete